MTTQGFPFTSPGVERIAELEAENERLRQAFSSPDWLPENPYFDSAMSIKSDKEYAALIPDPTLRTAASWYIGNRTWKLAMEAVLEAAARALGDE